MLALAQVTVWYWVAFTIVVLVLLGLDLGVFHSRSKIVSFKEALVWTGIWFLLALLFATAFVRPRFGLDLALKFTLAYLIELSLSIDNVFVMALIFAYFAVPSEFQRRLLFLGVIGALFARGAMIALGVVLVHRFAWLFYPLGIFLIYSGFRMFRSGGGQVKPDQNLVIRLARKLYPVSSSFDGDKLVTRRDGRRVLTPLALVLLMIETTDVLFAADSIPAIFAITLDPFVIFTSNVLAILGLRSLYFVLARAIAYFRYLKAGLAMVLVFIGFKMLAAFHYEVPTGVSLGVVAGVLLLSVALSLVAVWRQRLQPATNQRC